MERQRAQTAFGIEAAPAPDYLADAFSVEDAATTKVCARDVATWSWATAFVPIVAWEIFLRFDSQVMGLQTKLWFFPLFGSALVFLAAQVGRLFAGFLPARVGGRVLPLILTLVTAVAFAAEYVGVSYYYSPERVSLWPLAAVSGAAFALGAYAAIRRILASRALRRVRPSPPRGRALPLLAALLAAAAASAIVVRPDVAACAVRRNTLIGRVLGKLLFSSRPPLAESGAPMMPPDLPSARKFPDGNVILISVDALRADFVSGFGRTTARTPRLEELAKRSILFESAFASRPVSAPSMASVLTGLYPANHGVRDNAVALRDDVTTLAEMLGAEGYATAGFVTNINFSKAFNFQQGFDAYEYLEPGRDADGLITDSSDPEVVDAALAWAAKHAGNKMFLWAHLNAPHSPYLPPAEFRPELKPGEGEWFNVLNMPGHLARVEGLRTYFDRDVYLKLYEAEVASVDRLVGRLLDGLQEMGALDDAQIIFIADHGEAFGEADDFGHGGALHPAETRVPLLWKLPGDVGAGTKVTTVVQLADLVPTLRDLSGRDQPPSRDGRILSGILLGEQPQDDGFAFTEAGWEGSVGTQAVSYAGRTRQRALWLGVEYPLLLDFDRTTDPMEDDWRRYEPSAEDPLFGTLSQLARNASSDSSRRASAVVLDQSQKERLRALGY